MDRDVYLLLIGAGISLASSIVTLLLKYFLDLTIESIRIKREREEGEVEKTRAELLRTDWIKVPGERQQLQGKYQASLLFRLFRYFAHNVPIAIGVGIGVFIGWILAALLQ